MPEACEAVEPLLSAHIDGQLDTHESAAVAGHLASCEPCAAQAEQLRVVRSLVSSLPVRRLPDQLALRPPVQEPVRSSEGAPALARVGAAVAITAGLLTGAAFSLGGQPPPEVRTVAVPMDVYVADHLVHTVNRAVSSPVLVELRR